MFTVNIIYQNDEDNKHMAYWLSATSTLLFLLQKSLSSGAGRPPQPTSFFGRVTQVSLHL